MAKVGITGLGLVATGRRNIKPGHEFDPLYSTNGLIGTNPIIGGDLSDTYDTLNHMANIVTSTLNDTKRVVGKLKGSTLEQTLRNIWNHVYNHFQYEKDATGIEQIRRPARSWADRKRGIDCDCMSVVISSLLHHLGISHTFRKTTYNEDTGWQHVYVTVPKSGTSVNDLSGNRHVDRSKYFVLDCVVDKFDYEVPYLKKFDKVMKVQYLNGLDFATINGGITTSKLQQIRSNILQRRSTSPILQRMQNATAAKDAASQKRLKLAEFIQSVRTNAGGLATKLSLAYKPSSEASKYNMAEYRKLLNATRKIEQMVATSGGTAKQLFDAVEAGKKVAIESLGNLDLTAVTGVLSEIDFAKLLKGDTVATPTITQTTPTVTDTPKITTEQVINILPSEAKQVVENLSTSQAAQVLEQVKNSPVVDQIINTPLVQEVIKKVEASGNLTNDLLSQGSATTALQETSPAPNPAETTNSKAIKFIAIAGGASLAAYLLYQAFKPKKKKQSLGEVPTQSVTEAMPTQVAMDQSLSGVKRKASKPKSKSSQTARKKAMAITI